jgi:hypothetical protein
MGKARIKEENERGKKRRGLKPSRKVREKRKRIGKDWEIAMKKRTVKLKTVD